MNILKKKNVIRSIADDAEIFSDDFDNKCLCHFWGSNLYAKNSILLWIKENLIYFEFSKTGEQINFDLNGLFLVYSSLIVT